ncbi:unnamed protein product, partial [Mesorhabditis spiculigera]
MGSAESKQEGKETNYPYSNNRPIADPCQLTRRALEECLSDRGAEEGCKALMDAHRKCLKDQKPYYPVDIKKST